MSVDHLHLQARLQPNRLAARDLTSGQAWTYREFDEAAWKMAGALKARGVEAGDRVAVLAKNRASLVLLHLACARRGAIYVPLNWRLSPQEFAPVLADAEPALILGDKQLETAGLDGNSIDEFEVEAAATNPLVPLPYNQHATSLILYTSGTSGRPKGVMLSEANLWATGTNFAILARIGPESAVLCDAPMFHVIGLVGNIRPALMHGGNIALFARGFLFEPAMTAPSFKALPARGAGTSRRIAS